MKNFKKLSLLCLLSITTACGGSTSSDKNTTPDIKAEVASEAKVLPKAEGLILKSVEATGGKAAYEAIKNYKMNGTFSIPAQKIVGTIEVIARADGHFRSALVIPGIGTERSGFDGTTVWSLSAITGARILEGAEREQGLRDSDMLKDLHWQRYYKSATTVELSEVEGKPAYKVDMIDNSDVSEFRYYDQESGLLVHQTGTVKSQMGEMKSSMYLRNYEEISGILTAKLVEMEVMGMKQELTIDTLEVNISIEDASFTLPEDIQALLKVKQ